MEHNNCIIESTGKEAICCIDKTINETEQIESDHTTLLLTIISQLFHQMESQALSSQINKMMSRTINYSRFLCSLTYSTDQQLICPDYIHH